MNKTEEVEVFRLCKFDSNKYYETAEYTRQEGRYPDIKYYTVKPVKYLGRYIRSERWGFHDNSGGAENFDDNGIQNRVEYNYDGSTCFREVPNKNN